MTVTTHDLRTWKTQGRRFAMLTAYDHPTARILDDAGIPVILVGDSVGNAVLGYDTTLPVTMEEMLHHTAAVSRGAKNALVVADLPFGSYQASVADGVRNATRFLKEAGAGAVKLEGAQLEVTEALTRAGIPVMGHVGFTPQSVNALGGYRVQGRGDDAARVLGAARALEQAGAFAVVLEMVTSEVAREATQTLTIPTIGIGAGPDCDAQVLVWQDMAGLRRGRLPKFVKTYGDLRGALFEATKAYASEVVSGSFPDDDHSYT